MARRGRTGRAVTHLKARRRVQVHKHHHRRYAGVRGGTAKPLHHRRPGVRHASKTGRHRTFRGRSARGHAAHRIRKGRHGHRAFHHRHAIHKSHVRKGLHRHLKHKRHSLHKRHMRAGLHRKFHGRKFHGRHVKPGQHRRFHGRKTTHHRGHVRPPKPKAAPISSASYLSMF
ncbi:hypothetical protein ACFFGR_09180 [Arthrobacter liuii]|nr:hypothetical protein [Arthrobacter liuii]